MCYMPPDTESGQSLSGFSQIEEATLCSVPQFALYDTSVSHALGQVNCFTTLLFLVLSQEMLFI